MASVETPVAPDTQEEVKETQGTKRPLEDESKENSKDTGNTEATEDTPKQKLLKKDHAEDAVKEDKHTGNGKAAVEEEGDGEEDEEDGEELGDEEEEGDLDGELDEEEGDEGEDDEEAGEDA